jgi:hypothetical protein
MEYKLLSQVRQVESYEWRFVQQQRCLVIVVDLPLEYPAKVEAPTSVLYLNNRFVEQQEEFEELRSFPLYVHVSIPKVANNKNVDSFDDLLHVAWAEIYDKISEAEIHA